MKRREYNKEEDGTRVSSQCPVVSCRIVLYRKEVEWVEGGRRGEKRKPGARSQDQNEKEQPPPPPIESYCTKQTNLHGKDEQVQGTGATAGTRAWANWGPTQSNPFR